jgi:hypothetical protein
VPGSEAIAVEVERIQSSAHELVEIRLMNALRTGAVALRPELEAEAARLLGADGADPRARLGLQADAADADVLGAFADALGRWQRLAENPIATGQTVEAARVVVRSCEALAGSLPAAPGVSRRS